MVEIPRPDATLMAWLASLAYRTPDAVREELARKRLVGKTHFFDREDTQALLIDGEDFDLLAFRGTEPANWRDWRTDASLTTSRTAMGRVHDGFRKALAHVAPAIEEHRSNPERPLFLSGHSLGGALAISAAAAHLEHPEHVGGVYTFGAPAAGNRKFARIYGGKLGGRTWRFENCLDIVPRILKEPLWSRPGHLFYFTANGGLVHNPDWRRRWAEEFRGGMKRREGVWKSLLPQLFIGQVVDHSMDDYEALVAANLEEIESVVSTGPTAALSGP